MNFIFLKFPFNKILPRSRLLIYGAGKLGLHLSELIEEKGRGKILGFIDQRAAERPKIRGYPVFEEGYLTTSVEADFFLVASHTYNEPITQKLKGNGIPQEKILSFEPIFLDDFLTSNGKLTFVEDGLCTTHNCDFVRDQDFLNAYKAAKLTNSWSGSEVRWRAHTLCWAAKQAFSLPGDFVECGVNKGGTARLVTEYTDFKSSSKRFFLLDTFDGLVKDQLTPIELEKDVLSANSCFSNSLQHVKETFKHFPNIVIIQGKIPDTLHLVNTDKVCFLSIDLNCAFAERAAIEFFWPKLVQGALVVLDDYGHSGHEEQKICLDRFAKAQQKEILSLPTGQGILIK